MFYAQTQLFSCFCVLFPSSHSACVMQERYIYVFGGWDTPVCYNDMYMLDLGEAHDNRTKSHWVWIYIKLKFNIFYFKKKLRSNGVFCCENVRKSSVSSKVHTQKLHFKSYSCYFCWNSLNKHAEKKFWEDFKSRRWTSVSVAAGMAVQFSQKPNSWSTAATTETTPSVTPSFSI